MLCVCVLCVHMCMDAHVCAGTSAFLSPVYGISSVDSKCLSQSSLLKQTISLNLEHTSVSGLEGQLSGILSPLPIQWGYKRVTTPIHILLESRDLNV